MNILRHCISNQGKLSAQLLRDLEHLVCRHEDALPRGWRAIVEMRQGDQMFFLLDAQDNGGGSFAEVKMQMLDSFPELPATGLQSPDEFCEMITPYVSTKSEEDRQALEDAIQAIRGLDGLNQTQRSVAECLRSYGLTTYMGAVRVPYEGIISTDEGDVRPTTGEIRIAFSGASAWQDLYFTCWLLSCLQASLEKLWEHDQIWYNLDGLRANAQTNLWLDLMQIKEA